MREYTYKAFISYRHTEFDKMVAGRLQKKLENYNPPRGLRRGREKWRIFRDETELPSSSDLNDEIREALDNSEFLIVICSSETARSRWCIEEIKYFKSLHEGRNDNIITLLIEGEPKEVFPKELCTSAERVIEADGSVSVIEKSVEPLAANITAETGIKSLRKLKTEFLRIAAPLLGCGYDDLYKRAHRRRSVRFAVGAAVIFTALTLFGLYSNVMLMQIDAQRKQLMAKNEELQTKTEQLNTSNKSLETVNADLDSTNSQLDETNRQLDDKNLQLNSTNSELESRNAELDKSNKSLDKANSDLKSSNDKLDESNNALKSANEKLNQSNSALTSANKKLDESNSALSTANSSLDRSNAELSDANKQLDTANSELSESNANLENKTREAQDNLTEANKQRDAAEANLAEANRQREIAEKNLAYAEEQRGIAEENLIRAEKEKQTAENNILLSGVRESKLLSARNNTLDAISAVMAAVPESYAGNDSLGDAENALAASMHAFDENIFIEQKILRHKRPIEEIGYVGKGKNIVTTDSNGIYLWDAESGRQIRSYTRNDEWDPKLLGFENTGVINRSGAYLYAVNSFLMKNGLILGYSKNMTDEESVSGSDFYIKSYHDLYKMSGETGDILWEWHPQDKMSIADIMYKDNVIAVYMGKKLIIIDEKDGSEKHTYNIPDTGEFSGGVLSYPNILTVTEHHCYVKTSSVFTHDSITALDINSDELVNPVTLPTSADAKFVYIRSLQHIDGTVYSITSADKDVLGTNSENYVEAYDDKSLKKRWSYKLPGGGTGSFSRVGRIKAAEAGNYCDIVFAASKSDVVLLEAESGSVVKEFRLDGGIAELYYSRDGFIYAITGAGSEILILARKITKDETDFHMFQMHDFGSDLNMCAYYNNSYLIIPERLSSEAHIYADKKNDDFEKIFEHQGSVKSMELTDDGRFALINTYNELYRYSFSDGRTEKLAGWDDTSTQTMLISNDKVLICEDYRNIFIYDLNTRQKKKVYECEESVYKENLYVMDNAVAVKVRKKVIFIQADGNIYEYNVDDRNDDAYDGIETGSIKLFSQSRRGNRYAVYNEYFLKTPERIEIHSPGSDRFVILDMDAAGGVKSPATCMEWIGNSAIAVLSEDNRIGIYDTESGALLSVWDAGGETGNDVVYITLLDETNLGIICSDSKMYRLNINSGFTGESIDLEEDNIKNLKASNFNSHKFSSEYDNGGNMLLSYQECVWVIDLNKFKIRYKTDGFLCYDKTRNKIGKGFYNKAGFFPLYSTEQLFEKARRYLNK